MTVSEAEPAIGTGSREITSVSKASAGLDLETAIINLITQDPFFTIKEIKAEINKRQDNLRTGWWQVFSVLRKRRLLTKRSRFRLIFGRH